jgi:hypothetical protein
MSYSPLSISRRHVLGDLYGRCDALTDSVPVFLAGTEPELLGHVDEALGHYADAFSFHLADDVCKKLSAGQFTYSFEYNYSDPSTPGSRSRVTLTGITLNARKVYEKLRPR